jgi:hypothetical protein
MIAICWRLCKSATSTTAAARTTATAGAPANKQTRVQATKQARQREEKASTTEKNYQHATHSIGRLANGDSKRGAGSSGVSRGALKSETRRKIQVIATSEVSFTLATIYTRNCTSLIE